MIAHLLIIYRILRIIGLLEGYGGSDSWVPGVQTDTGALCTRCQFASEKQISWPLQAI
jgi:hypothetical protein